MHMPIMSTHPKEPIYPESGMTLIEVLIAMVILSIGFLAIGYMQINAAQYVRQSAINSRAALITSAMLAELWGAGNQSVREFNAVKTSSPSTWPTSGIPALDVSRWANQLQKTLPDGKGSVQIRNAAGNACTQLPCTATVTVTWSSISGTQTHTGSEYLVEP